MKQRIIDILPKGKENRMSADALQSYYGFKHRRDLHRHIHTARLNGELILSTKENGGGYYAPKDNAEIAEFYRTYYREAIALFSMLKTARQSLADVPGQTDLFEV